MKINDFKVKCSDCKFQDNFHGCLAHMDNKKERRPAVINKNNDCEDFGSKRGETAKKLIDRIDKLKAEVIKVYGYDFVFIFEELNKVQDKIVRVIFEEPKGIKRKGKYNKKECE